jgi:hypothetical protein
MSRYHKLLSLPGSPPANQFLAVKDTFGFEAIVTNLSGAARYWKRNNAVVNEYTTAGDHTWTKPAGAKIVKVLLIGGGGGGGNGRVGASGTTRYYGGGGSGGAISEWTFLAASLPASVTVTIGAGGSGASVISTPDTDGSAGSQGGDTLFGSLLIAKGGFAGGGGTATVQAAAGAEVPGFPPVQSSNNGASGGGAGLYPGVSYRSPGGGGRSGYFLASNTPTGGQAGSVISGNILMSTSSDTTQGYGGAGGDGGPAFAAANGTSGVNGFLAGGGGGGGAPALNGFNSGAGGNGARGFARIVTLF